MTTTDQRVCLLMSTDTMNELWLRAELAAHHVDAQQLMAAIREREAAGIGWRVRCDQQGLRFIREQAPELARLWPEVFGPVVVPRAATISQVCAAVGQTGCRDRVGWCWPSAAVRVGRCAADQ